jgi:hypothetical protein
MFDQVDDYAHRPMRYRNIDGIWEMGAGFYWLVWVLLEKFRASAPGNSVWHRQSTHVLCLAVLVSVVFYGVGVLKKRITYPRTGFVKYRDLAPKPWIVGAIGLVVGVAAYALVLRRFSFSLTVAVASAMFGLLYAFATKLDGAYRWVVLVVMVAGPMAISTLPLDRLWLETLSIGFLGLTLFVSGGITLYLYLRRTRPSQQEAE